MKRRKIIFGVGSGILLLLVVIVLAFGPLSRIIFTEKGNFPEDTWEKSVFLDAEENQAVIVNLGPVQEWRFFLNRYEAKSLAYFLLNKQERFVVSIKDNNGNLVDKINLSNHIKPGDIVSYEWNGDNSGKGESLKICIYHSDLSFEKIPVVFQNPFKL